jgi:RNA polymerase sigma factor (sigma-70 family)
MAQEHPQASTDVDDTVDLLARARDGDREALDRLFERHVPLLRRWAAGRLPQWARDAADTSDLIQEKVVQTLKHLDTFEHRGDGALQAYLRQAVINRIRNVLRKAAGRPRAAELEIDLPDDRTSPLEAAIGLERLQQYEAGLARLRPDERDAIVGRVELGMSYADLAAALEKPSSDAARMFVVRALMKLAREMNPPR